MKARDTKPAELVVQGCHRCPFAVDLWAGCTHPEGGAAGWVLSGYTDDQIRAGKTPRDCPLRTAPLLVSLRRRRAGR